MLDRISQKKITRIKSSFFLFRLFFFIAVGALLTGCSSHELRINQNRPLDGKNVSVHRLADGQIELRLKVSELTSNVWFTTELINKSDKTLNYSSDQLIQIQESNCLINFALPRSASGSIGPQQRIQLRYSYQDIGKQTYNDRYDECKKEVIRVQVSGLALDNQIVQPIQLTIE